MSKKDTQNLRKEEFMEHISAEEQKVIRYAHLRGTCIVVIAHAPQEEGGCHPFQFMRGVLVNETPKEAFERVKTDILDHISGQCGRECQCSNGKPVINYRIFGR